MDILALLRDLQRETARPDTVATLTRLVVAADAAMFGAFVYSVAELGLRAQTFGLLLALDALSDAMRQVGHRGQLLYSGRFREFIDAFNFVFDSIPHIHRRLRAAQASPGSSIYHDGVRAAQDALASIASDADLRNFLQEGSRATVEPARRACIQLQELLAFRIPHVPDNESVPNRPRSRPCPTFQPHV